MRYVFQEGRGIVVAGPEMFFANVIETVRQGLLLD